MDRVLGTQTCEMILPTMLTKEVGIERIDLVDREIGGCSNIRAKFRHLLLGPTDREGLFGCGFDRRVAHR